MSNLVSCFQDLSGELSNRAVPVPGPTAVRIATDIGSVCVFWHNGRISLGDPVPGMSHLDIIKLFNDDPETKGIIMIGEIGGTAEEEAAAWVQENCNKPVAGFIAGATAPPGRRMGHAGAIVSGGKGTAAAKKEAMREAGIGVAETPSEMADTLLKMM